MTTFTYAVFVFFGPIITVFIPKIFGDISLLWFAFYLLIILFLFRLMTAKETINLMNAWIMILAFFYCVTIASITWSDHYGYDLNTLKRVFAHYLVPLCISFIALNIFRSDREMKHIVRYACIAATILSLLSIFQMIFGYQMLFQNADAHETYRASATFSNPNGLAIFLVLCIPLVLHGLDRKFLPVIIALLSLACILGGIVCTVSRKGITTAALAFFMYFLFKKKFKYVLVSVLVFLCVAGIIASHSIMSQRFTSDRLAVQFEGKASMVMAGIDMFLDSPLIGIGYQGYYENFSKYLPGTPKKKYDAHNIYITVLANSGLLGFIPFMAAFLYPLFIGFRTLWGSSSRYSPDMAIICIISIITFMLNGFYGGGLFVYYPIMILFYTNIALLFSYKQDTCLPAALMENR